jgi:hypothetical protein
MPFDDPTTNALARAIREAFPVEGDSEGIPELLEISTEKFPLKEYPEVVGEGTLAVLMVLSHTSTEAAWDLCGTWLLTFACPELHRDSLAEMDRKIRKLAASGDPDVAADLADLVE